MTIGFTGFENFPASRVVFPPTFILDDTQSSASPESGIPELLVLSLVKFRKRELKALIYSNILSCSDDGY